MFYSDAQYEEYQADLIGDGYQNEFQRAYAVSQLGRSVIDERPDAARLSAAGKFVVCVEHEVCCSVTDGLLGYDFVIIKVCDTHAQAEILVSSSYDAFIYQPELPGLAPQTPINEDDIPF